jgi:hypothetical protein
MLRLFGMWSRSRFLGIGWISVAPVVIGACAEPPTEPGPPPDAVFRIEPANPILVAGGTLQFRALSPNGAELSVYWRLQHSDFGTIGGSGLLASCLTAGTTEIAALRQADTTKRATTQLTLVQPAIALVSVVAVYYVATAAPARLDSLAGLVDATVNIAAGIMACREVTAVRLELVAAGAVTQLGEISFLPPLTATIARTFRWNAAAFPPGPYALRAVIAVRDHGEQGSTGVPIEIQP